MLASRGFVYASAKTAGEENHYHAFCDCRIVPGWEDTAVEGYDPKLIEDKLKHPEKHAQKDDDTLRSFVDEWLDEATRSVGAAYNEAYKEGYRRYVERVTDVARNEIHRQRQENHIKGTQAYKNTKKQRGEPQSAFTISFNEVDDLVAKHIGNGRPEFDKKGNWTSCEICVADHDVGFVYGYHGQELDTSQFKIHYDKDGVHAVPMYYEGGEPDELKRYFGKPWQPRLSQSHKRRNR